MQTYVRRFVVEGRSALADDESPCRTRSRDREASMGFRPISWNRSSKISAVVTAVVLAATATTPAWAGSGSWWRHVPRPAKARSPIEHVVVIFDENISFDHYFGTYPKAANTDGTTFHAAGNTPKVNGLFHALLTNNPNTYNPARLTHFEALTCDQDHGYGHE